MADNDYPKEGKPMNTKDHPDVQDNGLVQDMYYQKAVDDRKEVDAGTRFYDTGTRIPGNQKAKNDAYMSKFK